MTTSNDETTPSPDVDATTPLPSTPAPLVGAGQDTTRQMPVSDPLAFFREAPTAQMPTDPFRSDADAAGATRAQGEADLLRACYVHSLDLAVQHGCKSVAFPCISTGVYGYPPDQAASIAVAAVRSYPQLARLDEVIFCCFGARDLALYERLLAA